MLTQGTAPTQFDSNGNPYFIDRGTGAHIDLPKQTSLIGSGSMGGIQSSIIKDGNAVADAEGEAAATEFQINQNRAGARRVADYANRMSMRRRGIGGSAVTGADKGLSIGALSGSATVMADSEQLKKSTSALGRAKVQQGSTDTLLSRLSNMRNLAQDSTGVTLMGMSGLLPLLGGGGAAKTPQRA